MVAVSWSVVPLPPRLGKQALCILNTTAEPVIFSCALAGAHKCQSKLLALA